MTDIREIDPGKYDLASDKFTRIYEGITAGMRSKDAFDYFVEWYNSNNLYFQPAKSPREASLDEMHNLTARMCYTGG